jgi:dihydroorotate dehydrogenase/ferredoxin
MPNKIHVNFAGLELKSPLIASAGPWTRTVRHIEDLSKAGIGAVVTKSTYPEDEYAQVMKPYAPHRFPDCRPKYVKSGRDVYNWVAGDNEIPAEEFAQTLSELKKKVDIPIIASAKATTPNGYARIVRMFEDAGVDAIELDFICPMPFLSAANYVGLRAAFLYPENVAEVIVKCKKEVSIPVGLKTPFNQADPYPLLEAIKSSKVDFVCVTYSPAAMSGIDLDTGKPYLQAPTTGISSPMRRLINYRYVVLTAQTLQKDTPPLAASGYAMTWRDCVEYIMYGCTAVQVNQVLMRKGPEVITRINEDLQEFLDGKGYSNITELRGMALPHLLPQQRFYDAYGSQKGKTKDAILPEVNADLCNQCLLCVKTCPNYAITMEDEEPVFDKATCQGCGLCVANCPTGALKLTGLETLYVD